ncbi:MAG: sugar ABC transporter ATP-binding protein [Lachnospiraceae bacterium]|jgi:simple sugar transport system ATP-binding protein|nr:sugar ABC transporter ATP-binding protein [Lachnospiraceae bacterium]
MEPSLLSFKNISKDYAGNQVLKDVNIEIKKGEIHALIGENGAGKSTLMNILFGMSVIHNTGGFEGSMEIDGVETVIKSPFEAMEHGIGMVHQEFMLIPGFTITENIKINREIPKKAIYNEITGKLFGNRMRTLDFRAMNQDARAALDTLGMDIEEFTLLRGLPIGYMQFIEIAREIDKKGIKLLVLDEPTAVLAESEADNLLKAMRNLASQGIAIIFISHRLNEIINVADMVTILRDGELVVTKPVSDTNAIEIAELMIGRRVVIDKEESTRELSDDIALSVKDLHVAMAGERVRGIDLSVRRGEIFGIGGLAGQGKLGIANGIMGIYSAKGEVSFEGKTLPLNNTRAVLKSGVGYVSEDRKGVGLLLDESIADNIVFTDMQIHGSFLKKFLGFISLSDGKNVRKHARQMIKDLDIRCTSELQHTGRLSGGNQQKVCVASALTQKPRLLFVSEPTRGIDIGAKKLILDLLRKLSNEQGMTIIITSSELVELCSICDRIAIVCEGRLAGILPPDATPVQFGLMMSGMDMGE